MKYRYLPIILLILIFSVGAVCAQDNVTDVISAGSDDVISVGEAPILQDNGSSADEIHINDANFNQYFDENGTMNDNVSADSTILIGEITNKSLYINKQVFVIPDETSKIMDSSITFIAGSAGSLIKGLTFNNAGGMGAISVIDADNITMIGNIISILSNINSTGAAILVFNANNFNATANVISYKGKSDDTLTTIAMQFVKSEDSVIEDNEILVIGESAYGIYTNDWAGDVKTNITNNKITVIGTNVFGMSLRGSNTVVDNNIITTNGNFTTGIVSKSDRIFINRNEIYANGTNEGTPTGYDAIETIGVHILEGDPSITNNKIIANSKYAVYIDEKGVVNGNEIYADMLTGDFAVDYVQDTGVIVVNNTPAMELTYKLTNDTFFVYFDEQGEIREQIDSDNLTFIGPFSNLVRSIFIFKPITLLSDNATLINIPLFVVSDNVTIDGFNFINKLSTILAYGSNNISIINNNINVTGNPDSINVVITIGGGDNILIDNNNIIFTVETNESLRNNAIYAVNANDIVISNNNINASLPARSINWTTNEAYSQGVCLGNCNDAIFVDNFIAVKSNDKIGDYDTIYAVYITGDDALVARNTIGVGEAPYGYALVIAGKDFIIANNLLAVAQNGTYACSIDVESNSNGIIDTNDIVAFGESSYGIYTADWDGDVKTNITNNFIAVNGTNVFAMSLSGSEALVENNTVYSEGNFTTGIAAAVDEISITNNTIRADGTNVGNPTSYDAMGIETIGVHIHGNALVKDNNITSNSDYTVSVQGTGEVTDNYLIANKYTGDASVNSTPGDTLVANNTPVMQRAIVTADNVVMYYRNGTRYVILLTDQNGKVLSNEIVTITLNGVSYNRTTDANGTASIAINLPSGNYTASVLYVGKGNFTNSSSENNITVLTTIFGDDIVKVFRNGTQYYATFLDGQGNPLAHGTDVTFNINGVFYTRQVNGSEGKAKLNINLKQGEYVITSYNLLNGEMHANNITVLPLIQSNDLVKYFRNESQFVVTVFGDDGNPVGAGENLTFNINGVFYTRQTDANGIAKLNINLQPGDYVITSEYNGCMVSNNIKVLPVLNASDISMKYRDGTQFKANLVDGQGKPFDNQEIIFNINGVFYSKMTDNNGQAKLNINLMPGEYIITSSYNGSNIANKITIQS